MRDASDANCSPVGTLPEEIAKGGAWRAEKPSHELTSNTSFRPASAPDDLPRLAHPAASRRGGGGRLARVITWQLPERGYFRVCIVRTADRCCITLA
jgi:hypothetical protein